MTVVVQPELVCTVNLEFALVNAICEDAAPAKSNILAPVSSRSLFINEIYGLPGVYRLANKLRFLRLISQKRND
jgi:hypothetical protein